MKSHHWFLIIAVGVVVYVLTRGGDEQFAATSRIDYDRLAVSQGMTSEASALDLAKDLDIALLPDIGKQVIREAAQRGLQKQAFVEHVIQEVGNRVREISTIDLNNDGTVDPVLIKPEAVEGEQYMLLSLRVPAPKSYPLPAASDTAAWKKVETLEVATMTVALNNKELTVQAQGNQHVYPNSSGNHYVAHDRSASFLQMYIGMRMMSWMFFPRYYGFWGPGYGYGMYRPMGVPMAMGRRGGMISSRGYSSSSASRSSAVRSRSGATPRSQYSRTYSSKAPKSLSQVRSSRSFQRRSSTGTRGGGFGRSATRSSSRSFSRSTSRSSGGFGRGFGRSSFGGGGFRFGK
ncbi:MAG: hypothetical protein O7E56_11820 [SAR324 cluster bacterium]|nr:hypothetical protein [SAR324 cluster bacterium]